MSNPLNLSALFSLLGQQNPAPASPVHFLFLLGTNTIFSQRPSIPLRNYERGETLSYTAQTVATLLGEKEQADIGGPDAAISYSSPSVDVLNGPDTRGKKVGEKIAEALMCTLSAAVVGKKVLQISAHSRGAVEGTLLTHELARIKRALNDTPEKSLKEILVDSPCNLTRAALIARFQGSDVEGETPELRSRLRDLLDKLEVNIFFIDPVPGDTVYGIPWVAWDDPRFYQKPPCNRYEWLLCEDERSNCFVPIVPEGIKEEILPGHHGTLSGNRYTQQLADLPRAAEYQDLNTTSVQDLVLCKWFHFVHKTTGIFPKPDVPIVLEQQHSELDAVMNQFLNAEDAQRNQQLLEYYQKVALDIPAYRYFRNSSYPVVGLMAGDRPVHYKKSALTPLTAIAPEMPQGFVNERHAELFLDVDSQFSQKLSADVDVQLATIDNSITRLLAEMQKGQGNLLRLVLSSEGERQFFNGLSILVDAISQKYLRNHLSADEKKRLMDIIHFPLKRLAGVKTEEGFTFEPIIRRCEEVLQNGIKQTLETHDHRLKERWETLEKKMKYFLAPQTLFDKIFDEYIDRLSVSDTVLVPLLEEIKQSLRQTHPIAIESVKHMLTEALLKIEGSEVLDTQQKDRLNSIMLSEGYQQLRLFVEAHETSIGQYLAMLEELYQGAEDLIQAYPQLLPLLGEQKLEINLRQVHLLKRDLIECAGILLKEKEHFLSQRPITVSESFYRLARDAAVAHGAILPEVLVLKQQLRENSEKYKRFELKNIEQAQMLKRLEEWNAEQGRAIRGFEAGSLAQVEKIRRLEEGNVNQGQTIEQLKVEKKALHEFNIKLCLPTERKAASLIEFALIPKTSKYLTHLIKEANRCLPANDKQAKAHLAKIQQKHEKVQALLLILSEKDQLPSQLLVNFKDKLTQYEQDLKQNRNDLWTSYIKSCLGLVAFLCTGVLPGLAYGVITGRSPLFFAERRTTGAAYVLDAQRDLSSIKLST